MNFFIAVHRSITDPSFFEEAARHSARRVFLYAFTLWISVCLVLTTAHYRLLTDRDNGLPYALSAAFPGMKVVAGKMTMDRPLPYVVPELQLSYLIGLASYSTTASGELPDSVIVVDSLVPAKVTMAENAIRLHVGEDKMRLFVSGKSKLDLPYRAFIAEGETVEFSSSGISEYLNRHALSILFNLFLQHGVLFGFALLGTVLLLSISSYVSRNALTRALSVCVRWAVYAFTPVALGEFLVGLSGARVSWVWEICIVISLFLIFRASFHVMSKKLPPAEDVS